MVLKEKSAMLLVQCRWENAREKTTTKITHHGKLALNRCEVHSVYELCMHWKEVLGQTSQEMKLVGCLGEVLVVAEAD